MSVVLSGQQMAKTSGKNMDEGCATRESLAAAATAKAAGQLLQ